MDSGGSSGLLSADWKPMGSYKSVATQDESAFL